MLGKGKKDPAKTIKDFSKGDKVKYQGRVGVVTARQGSQNGGLVIVDFGKGFGVRSFLWNELGNLKKA